MGESASPCQRADRQLTAGSATAQKKKKPPVIGGFFALVAGTGFEPSSAREYTFLLASERIVRRWPTEFYPTVSGSTALLDFLFHLLPAGTSLGVERG